MKCPFCEPKTESVLMAGTHCQILIPDKLHISPFDGGHLIVIPNRHIDNRMKLREIEVLEMWDFSKKCASALRHLFDADWFNFQENGNWSLNNKKLIHMHLHIYGRSKKSLQQPYGEAIRMPYKSEIQNYSFSQYSNEMISSLKLSI